MNNVKNAWYHRYEVMTMFKDIMFFIYTAMIPLVPLYGVGYYTKRPSGTKRAVCVLLFVMQIFISCGSIIKYFELL